MSILRHFCKRENRDKEYKRLKELGCDVVRQTARNQLFDCADVDDYVGDMTVTRYFSRLYIIISRNFGR